MPWDDLARPEHAQVLEHTRALLTLRAEAIVPLLVRNAAHGTYASLAPCGIAIDWTFAARARLHLRANLGDEPCHLVPARGRQIHAEGPAPAYDTFAPWSGVWTLES
jgi:hypothetical protein